MLLVQRSLLKFLISENWVMYFLSAIFTALSIFWVRTHTHTRTHAHAHCFLSECFCLLAWRWRPKTNSECAACRFEPEILLLFPPERQHGAAAMTVHRKKKEKKEKLSLVECLRVCKEVGERCDGLLWAEAGSCATVYVFLYITYLLYVLRTSAKTNKSTNLPGWKQRWTLKWWKLISWKIKDEIY